MSSAGSSYSKVPQHDESCYGADWTPSIHTLLAAVKRRPTRTLLVLVFVLVAACWLVAGGERDYTPIPLQLLLSDYDVNTTRIHKIDAAGVYQRWDDITTVMPVYTQLSDAYERAYELMRAHYSHLLTPTPVSSYHVTLTSVIGLHFQPLLATYNSLIAANQRRIERLKHFFAQQSGNMTFVVNASTSFPLTAPYPTTVRLSPKTPDDQARWEFLNITALSILGELHVDNIPPHLGLGYKRRGLLYNDEVHGELRELMRGLRSIYEGAEVVVDMPRLCVITSMTDFPPV